MKKGGDGGGGGNKRKKEERNRPRKTGNLWAIARILQWYHWKSSSCSSSIMGILWCSLLVLINKPHKCKHLSKKMLKIRETKVCYCCCDENINIVFIFFLFFFSFDAMALLLCNGGGVGGDVLPRIICCFRKPMPLKCMYRSSCCALWNVIYPYFSFDRSVLPSFFSSNFFSILLVLSPIFI